MVKWSHEVLMFGMFAIALKLTLHKMKSGRILTVGLNWIEIGYSDIFVTLITMYDKHVGVRGLRSRGSSFIGS